jgi:dipeptidyl aminopeptidase/acylaminoacyl peptidase
VLSRAQLSPDGSKVALRVTAPGKPAWVAVLDLATMKSAPVAAFGDIPVDDFRWVSDQRLLMWLNPPLVGPNLVEVGSGLFAVDADGQNFRQLVKTQGFRWLQAPEVGTPMLPASTRFHAATQARNSDTVLVRRPEEISRERIGYWQLSRLDTRTGKAVEVEAPLHTEQWLFDRQGTLRAVQTRQGMQAEVLWKDADSTKDQPWRRLDAYNVLRPSDHITLRHIGPDGLLYVEAPQGDKTALFTLDVKTGRRSAQPVAASADFDIHPGLITAADGRLRGLRYTIDAEVTQWLDADAQAVQALIDEKLPRTTNRLSLPQRGDSPWVLVQAQSDVQPPLTLLYHRQKKTFTRLGSSHPDIQPADMGPTDLVRLKARDGLQIPAWLTLPPGGATQALPMVVLVHGGPWVRGHSWRWDAEVQFLASRGYAVLQPEFRGSTGYGARHYEAGFKQWGQAMQTDIADATRWVIAQGTADPKRICIAGASYGGYATLMGLAQNPELFRCGIAWAGVSDIDLMYSVAWSDFRNEYKREGMPVLIGDRVADAAMLKAASPLHNASRIRQPLLLAHGAWDVRVPIVHGEALRDALKPHNPNVEWVVYGNEGHGWTRLENNVDFWGRVERLLARSLETP